MNDHEGTMSDDKKKWLFMCLIDDSEYVFLADECLSESGVRERLMNIDEIHIGSRCKVRKMRVPADLRMSANIGAEPEAFRFWL